MLLSAFAVFFAAVGPIACSQVYRSYSSCCEVLQGHQEKWTLRCMAESGFFDFIHVYAARCMILCPEPLDEFSFLSFVSGDHVLEDIFHKFLLDYFRMDLSSLLLVNVTSQLLASPGCSYRQGIMKEARILYYILDLFSAFSENASEPCMSFFVRYWHKHPTSLIRFLIYQAETHGLESLVQPEVLSPKLFTEAFVAFICDVYPILKEALFPLASARLPYELPPTFTLPCKVFRRYFPEEHDIFKPLIAKDLASNKYSKNLVVSHFFQYYWHYLSSFNRLSDSSIASSTSSIDVLMEIFELVMRLFRLYNSRPNKKLSETLVLLNRMEPNTIISVINQLCPGLFSPISRVKADSPAYRDAQRTKMNAYLGYWKKGHAFMLSQKKLPLFDDDPVELIAFKIFFESFQLRNFLSISENLFKRFGESTCSAPDIFRFWTKSCFECYS